MERAKPGSNLDEYRQEVSKPSSQVPLPAADRLLPSSSGTHVYLIRLGCCSESWVQPAAYPQNSVSRVANSHISRSLLSFAKSILSAMIFSSSYIVEEEVCYLTLTEKSYPRGLAFRFLEDVRDSFVSHLRTSYGNK